MLEQQGMVIGPTLWGGREPPLASDTLGLGESAPPPPYRYSKWHSGLGGLRPPPSKQQ